MGLIKQIWQAITGGSASFDDVLPKPDTKLILDLQKASRPMGIEPPYLAHFKKENKNLCYVAAQHAAGDESATFQTIRDAVATFQPDFVIVEGLRTNLGSSPAELVAESKQDAKEHFIHAYESSYAAHLAHESGVSFIGGEPPHEMVLSNMQTHGYTPTDLMAGYLLRMIPVWRNQGELNEKNFEKQAMDYFATDSFCMQFSPEKQLTFAKFEDWYQKHATPGKTYLQLEQEDFKPMNLPNSTYLERQNYWASAVRDKHLVETISNALSEHDRVMVVYGSSHLEKSRPVLQKMFGSQGTNIQLYTNVLVEPEPQINSHWADKAHKPVTPELSAHRA